MSLTLHTDGIGDEADEDAEDSEAESSKKGARMTTGKVGCPCAPRRRVFIKKGDVAQGDQLLLDGQRQEQKPKEGGSDEVAAHWEARRGEARPQVMIYIVALVLVPVNDNWDGPQFHHLASATLLSR